MKLAWAAVAVLAAVGCGGGRKAKPVPKGAGRAVAVACATPRPPGNANAALGGDCKVDADCTKGANGRCTALSGRVQRNACTYDECATDADCKSAPCECNENGNFCAPGTCKLDSECGAGNYCLGNRGECGGAKVYHCTSDADTCTPDAGDCGKDGSCRFSAELGHYACEEKRPCPVG